MADEASEAYAFFYCNASEQEIEKFLPKIRKEVRTPSELELTLTSNPEKISDWRRTAKSAAEEKLFKNEYYTLTADIFEGKELDRNYSRFTKFVERIALLKGEVPKYAMKATHPRSAKTDASTELSCILNDIYQSPLFEAGEPFIGAIVHKENEKYVFRE